MYKTIRFEIALCTNTKDKAQRKKKKCGEHRRGKVKTKQGVIFLYFLGGGFVFLLWWVKRFQALCLFSLLPTHISAGNCIMIIMILMLQRTNGECGYVQTHMDGSDLRWHLWPICPVCNNQHKNLSESTIVMKAIWCINRFPCDSHEHVSHSKQNIEGDLLCSLRAIYFYSIGVVSQIKTYSYLSQTALHAALCLQHQPRSP